jgi:hypothetical protein
MSKQFVVMFDRCGVDTLIPCDEMKTREMLEWLGGKPHQSELARHIRMAMIRAQYNNHRFPEVWVYDCEQDFSESEMREMWNNAPQTMADLVRQKGTCLFKNVRDKQLIN